MKRWWEIWWETPVTVLRRVVEKAGVCDVSDQDLLIRFNAAKGEQTMTKQEVRAGFLIFGRKEQSSCLRIWACLPLIKRWVINSLITWWWSLIVRWNEEGYEVTFWFGRFYVSFDIASKMYGIIGAMSRFASWRLSSDISLTPCILHNL